MKYYNKILVIFLTGILLSLNIELAILKVKFISNNPTKECYDYDINLHISGFWNIDPIIIDGTGTGVGAHNWTWAESQPWCSGSGILADPYIIENVTIQGNGFSSCITIKNSNSYFNLTNSTFYDAVGISYAGIELNNMSNAYITNNTCYDNYLGIKVLDSKDNLLEGNAIKDNNDGIFIDFCEKNIVSDNIVNNNRWGIYLGYCNNNSVKNNSVAFNKYGIYLFRSSFNNVSENLLSNNERCIVDLEGEGNIYTDNGECVVYYGDSDNLFFISFITIISIISIIFANIAFVVLRSFYSKKKHFDKKPKKINKIVFSVSVIVIIIILIIFLVELFRISSSPL